MSDKLTIKERVEGKYNVYFTFIEKDYTVVIDKSSGNIRCDCFNGSNMGVNNKQYCFHKKLVLRLFYPGHYKTLVDEGVIKKELNKEA